MPHLSVPASKLPSSDAAEKTPLRLLGDGGPGSPGRADSHPLRLPAADVSVPRARHAVDRWLRGRDVSSAIRDQVALVLSELTANAIRHTDSGWIVCGVALTPEGAGPAGARRGVQVEVHDDGSIGDLPHRLAPSPDRESGRGLHIVEALASRWGVLASPVTRGSAVWALLLP